MYEEMPKSFFDGFLKDIGAIERWLKSHYVTNYEILPSQASWGYEVNVYGDVNFEEFMLGSIPVKFGKVTGNFICARNNLHDLRAAPSQVGGIFNCSNNKLKNLIGGPLKANGVYNCSSNELTTLQGAPSSMNGDFQAQNNLLTNFEGVPKEIIGALKMSSNKLSSLEHFPNFVGGMVFLISNPLLGEEVPRIHSFDILREHYIKECIIREKNKIDECLKGSAEIDNHDSLGKIKLLKI